MSAVVAGLRARARGFAASEAGRGATVSLGLKVVGSALNLLMLFLLARGMEPGAFGVFALWYNGALFLSVLATGGQEKLILRSWSEHVGAGRPGLARGAVRFGWTVSICGGTAVSGTAGLVALAAGQDPLLVASAAAFLLVQTVYKFTSNLNCALVGILSADGHDATWRGVVGAGALVAVACALPLSPPGVFWLASLGTAAAVAAQAVAARRGTPPAVREALPRYDHRAWAGRSAKMAAAGIMEAASEFLEVVLVGVALGPLAAGGYFVAVRLANSFAMITGGLHSFANRQISRQFYGEGRAALHGTLRTLAGLTTLLVALGALAVVTAGPAVLALFGPTFAAQYPLLLMLSLGTAIAALGGPASTVLLVTGSEGAYSAIVATSVLGRLAAVAGAALLLGPLGAAVASALMAAATAGALNVACRRLAGFDPSATLLLSRSAPA